MSYSYNTEIVYGLDAIIERTLRRLSKADRKIDVCVSATASEAYSKNKTQFRFDSFIKKSLW